MARHPLVIGHRGAPDSAPENTLAAFRAALAAGVDGIETDLHASADGVPVLIHDASLDRTTTGAGPVSALTFAELRRLDAGGHGFDGRFAGEPIPSLTEALELLAGRCLLVAEIKQAGIADLVIAALRRAGAVRSTMVWSFNLETVSEVRRLEPLLPAAWLTLAVPSDPALLFETVLSRQLSGVSVYHAAIDAALVRAARARGLSVYAWTADDPAEQRRLAECDVDAIVSNSPSGLKQALASVP